MQDLDPQPPTTLILLHGAALNSRMWDAVRRHLDPRYPVLAPDLPGHGSRIDGYFTLSEAVGVVNATVESVAPAPVILVGDSLGGYSAMAASAALNQKQLMGLVISGASYDFTGPVELNGMLRGWLLRALAAVIGEQRLIRRLMPKALGPSGFGLSPEDGRAILAAGMSIAAHRQAVTAIRAKDWHSVVAGIAKPIALLNGDEDTPNVRDEAAFLSLAQNATCRRFACKHGVSLWKPKEFAEAVNEFVARLTGTAA
jgi:pimeloyl-ACP methyl ester carboxylesterase